jgi:protein SCO1
MRYLFLFLAAFLLLAACQKQEPKPEASADAKRYKLKGKVVSVDKAKKKASIDHDEIPGYMPAMTMDFPIRADWVWEDLRPGAEIRAELVVDETADPSYWLEALAIVAAPNENQPPPPVNEQFASIGKQMIDFALTNQDGKRITAKDFAGKAWALTFIYAQCPLPDACIKMSTNFSDAANQLNGSDLKDRIRLLSISFDPARDTPEKLRQYRQGYLGKDVKPEDSIWQTAVGTDAQVRPIADFFGLRYEVDENDKTLFNHSLRTAVIGPDGKVRKIISGNDWTPNDLQRELKAALDGQ